VIGRQETEIAGKPHTRTDSTPESGIGLSISRFF
jgi:hypothetical protein